ncbi:hypothetical protein Nans01_01370 [Nocardiopsis ansamitocini]|uniref:Uncharacterized protein n=1 Tax=Nocardiopsis ansamitocini TaxID=1670832 RepID=A0A9W6P2A0_9ACTN|nr:hypothetical protein Nans01_01370 [Nocardiopsis ansamitocini]
MGVQLFSDGVLRLPSSLSSASPSPCGAVVSQISGVRTAAQQIESEVRQDGSYYEGDYTTLERHLDALEKLEEDAGEQVVTNAGERADAVADFLNAIDAGDEAGVTKSLDLITDTDDSMRSACS